MPRAPPCMASRSIVTLLGEMGAQFVVVEGAGGDADVVDVAAA